VDLRAGALVGGAAAIAVLAAAGIARLPEPALLVVAAAGVALALALGPEVVAVGALLTAFGFAPFLDPTLLVSKVPIWFLGFASALTAIVLTWAARRLWSPPSVPLRGTWLLLLLGILLVYSVLRLVASEPLAEPWRAAAFVALPLAALCAYVWLSDVEALDGIRRALPLAVVAVGAWCVFYLLAGLGCATCGDWVGSYRANQSFIGTQARIYTHGQNVMILVSVLAFASALKRPNPVTIGMTLLTVATVVTAQSRAQYLALLAGMAVVLIWRAATLKFTARTALVVAVALSLVLILQSPVAERAQTGITELQQGAGTPAYRVNLVNRSSEYWSLFGTGIDNRLFLRGFDDDLGIPNTLLTLGFLGAAMQLGVLALGLFRGVAARNFAGIAVAAVFAVTLAARPSLPYLEQGNSAVALGIALGVACALPAGRERSA
jgi:hypothetical protein